MREGASWTLWLIFALLLVVTGFEGSLGKVLACVLTPEIVEIS